MPSDRAEYDRDTTHPLAAPTYNYGDRHAELNHGSRELQQLQLGFVDGALSEAEYDAAAERVRDRHGIRPWGRAE